MIRKFNKLIPFFVLAMILIMSVAFISPKMSLAATVNSNTISGIISLPGGETAPIGGIEGSVNIWPQNGGNGYGAGFTIAEGTSSANYTVIVPTNSTATGYRVSYYLYSDDSSIGYVRTGYYSTGGTTGDNSSATPVEMSVDDVSGIDLTLLKGAIVSGTVSLPVGKTAPMGGIEGSVNIWPQNGGNGYWAGFTIAEGMRSANYAVIVPENSTATGYRVGYILNSDSSSIGYVSSGYYATGGTTANYDSATPVEVSGDDVSGIDLTLLKGAIVSGTVSLPVGKTAPMGGVEGNVNISPQNGGNGYGAGFTIAEGTSSANYTVIVPANSTATGYRVSYNLNSDGSSVGYVRTGYYSTGGTTGDNSSATPVEMSTDDVSGIDLTLLKGAIVSGTVSLPGGKTAPMGGIEGSVNIWPENGSNSYWAGFTIAEGTSSANYTVMVPENLSATGYCVGYNLNSDGSSIGYVRTGYYSTEGTKADYSSATPVEVSADDISGIDLTLLKGTSISGTISLPGGETAPMGGIEGSVNIWSQNGGNGYGAGFTIAEGTSSANYTVIVPEKSTATGYRVSYNLNSDGSPSEYVRTGYYSPEGTTTNYDSATPVEVSGDDVSRIDLTLLKGAIVSGTVSLPVGKTAPMGGIEGSVNIWPQNGGNSYWAGFTIAEGTSSANYTVIVPEKSTATGYRVSYNLKSDGSPSEYVRTGYYSPEGTTADYSSSTPVEVSADDVSGIDLTLLKGTSISGIISLPGGKTAPTGGIEGSVDVSPQNGGNSYIAEFTIAEGTSSANYTAMVPANLSATGYRVRYDLNSDDGSSSEYVRTGYYSTEGTTADYSSSTPVEVSADDVSGIDLTLLKGISISGTISLPGGKTAPTGGIEGRVVASPQNGGNDYDVYFKIAEGTSLANYTATVPANSTATGYRVSYNLYNNSSSIGYESSGYYSTEGTTTNYNSATPIEVSADDVSNINLTLLTTDNIDFSATPVVQIGVNPNSKDGAGIFIGLENVKDPTSALIGDAKITGYTIEVNFDPSQVSIADVIDETNSGMLFSKNIDTTTALGKVIVSCDSGVNITNFNQLFFVPISLKGSAQDVTSISVKYLDVMGADFHTIQVPTLDNIQFQRGKIYNGDSSVTPNIADAVAGLQYLAKIKNAGLGSEDVNPVNMASITESDANANGVEPNVKDIIALMQYLENLRDEHFMPFNGESLP